VLKYGDGSGRQILRRERKLCSQQADPLEIAGQVDRI